MCATILVDPDVERRLQAFLQDHPASDARPLEILAHAWTTVGGRIQVGSHAVRLLASEEPPVTAATLLVRPDAGPVLEVGRVVLEQHGLESSEWATWCDERPELVESGFDRAAKYPAVTLRALGKASVLRLALGLRDLYLAMRRAQDRQAEADILRPDPIDPAAGADGAPSDPPASQGALASPAGPDATSGKEV